MKLKLNKKLLDIFKKTKTTSDEDTYTCSYINDIEDTMNDYIGGSHISITNLLNNEFEVSSGSVSRTLNQSVINFDLLIVLVRGDWNHCKTIVIPKGLHGYAYDCFLYSDDSYKFSGYINMPTATTIQATKAGGLFNMTVMQVFGIKFE